MNFVNKKNNKINYYIYKNKKKKEFKQKKLIPERKKTEKMNISNTSKNTFMYSTDGFKSKTFSGDRLHKKVFGCGKNSESEELFANNFKGKKHHQRETSIRNLFESQIVLS